MILTMSIHPPAKPFLRKLGGYYAVPHELLHVLAYRIIGKPCHYHWGDFHVRPLAPETETRHEKLFVLLLPFAVLLGSGLFCQFLWVMSAFFITLRPEQYFRNGPTWHLIFLILGAFLVLYASTAHIDLILAYRVLLGQDESQNQSPQPHREADHQQH
jgi:hypothetical protein